MENVDEELENADWTKQTWDLPPYKSKQFMARGVDLEAFRHLPVYQHAVANGLIKDDQWVGPVEKAMGTELLRKVQREKRVLPAIDFDRPAVRKATKSMARKVYAFFNKIKPVLIKQVTDAYGKIEKIDQADLDEIDSVMSEVDFGVLNLLPEEIEDELSDVFEDAGTETLKTVGVAVTASKVPDLELAPKAFDQVNALAVEYAQERSAELVGMKWVNGKLAPNPNAKWQITDETRNGVRATVMEAVVGELPVTKLADTLSAAYGFSSDRAEMIARTEMRMANGNGALAGYIASGVVQEKVWLTAQDDDVSEECAENEDEGPIGIEEEFPSGDLTTPAHPNCLPGSVKITSCGRVAAFSERWYDGQMITLRTATDKQLTCTPNHPVLTDHGWVPARLLNEGSKVVIGFERKLPSNDDDYKVPTRIEDIARALRGACQPASISEMKITTEDFHGDGAGSKIAIIGANGGLSFALYAAFDQPFGNQNFKRTYVQPFALHYLSALQTFCFRVYAATASIMRRCILTLSGFGSFVLPFEQIGFAVATGRNPINNKPSSNSRPTDTEFSGQSILGFASKVFFDKILLVKSDLFHGLVYNLETSDECYFAGGILTHNCRCTIAAHVDFGSDEQEDTEEE